MERLGNGEEAEGVGSFKFGKKPGTFVLALLSRCLEHLAPCADPGGNDHPIGCSPGLEFAKTTRTPWLPWPSFALGSEVYRRREPN